MANPEHLEILKQGVEVWNKWREENENIEPNLSGVKLIRAKLIDADFSYSDLSCSDLSYSNLDDADLSGADLTEATLSHASLSYADLTEADLKGADLIEANLYGADLIEADLTGADLTGADLRVANLTEANLRSADLEQVNFAEAFLIETNLRKAYLQGVDLRSADLRSADFRGAILGNSTFGFTNLTDCIGVEKTKHNGPSIIEERTTKLDYKNLPVKFLTGCGLNKWQIEAIKLNDPELNENQITDIVYEIDRLRNKSPIQINNVFISYSRKDEPIVETIEKQFNEKDIRYWRDIHHSTAGPLEKQVSNAIHLNPIVLLILSKNSIESDWVEWEISKARELEKKLKRHVICPVALDNSWKDAPWSNVIMNQVKKYNILDFSGWRNKEAFQEQFAKLLKGLNIFYRKEAE